MMNYTICLNVIDQIQYLSMKSRQGFSCVFLLVGICNLTLNSVTLVTIYKTRQLGNQSTRLIFFVSIADILWAIFGDFGHAVYVITCHLYGCAYRQYFLLVTNLVAYGSLDLTMVIGLDRFLHIYYLQEYNTHFTSSRFKIVMAIYFCVVIVQSIGGPLTISTGYTMAYIVLPLNLIVLFGTIGMYCYSIKKLRTYQNNQCVLSNTNKSIIKIGSLYLLIIVVCLMPGIIVQMFFELILKYGGHKTAGFLGAFIVIIANLSGGLNAIIFLLVNVQAKRYLKRLFSRRRVIVQPNIIFVN